MLLNASKLSQPKKLFLSPQLATLQFSYACGLLKKLPSFLTERFCVSDFFEALGQIKYLRMTDYTGS